MRVSEKLKLILVLFPYCNYFGYLDKPLPLVSKIVMNDIVEMKIPLAGLDLHVLCLIIIFYLI